jgi:hypothetical protein
VTILNAGVKDYEIVADTTFVNLELSTSLYKLNVEIKFSADGLEEHFL